MMAMHPGLQGCVAERDAESVKVIEPLTRKIGIMACLPTHKRKILCRSETNPYSLNLSIEWALHKCAQHIASPFPYATD